MHEVKYSLFQQMFDVHLYTDKCYLVGIPIHLPASPGLAVPGECVFQLSLNHREKQMEDCCHLHHQVASLPHSNQVPHMLTMGLAAWEHG